MEMEKVAHYALGRFHNTYRNPSDIERSFGAAIKKMAAADSRMFAEEVYALMHYVTLDVIRSRISSDSTWQDIASGKDVDKKREDFQYKKLMIELMIVLIRMHSSEHKRRLKRILL